MLVDTHTNLMWYPDHYSDEFVETAWEAKRSAGSTSFTKTGSGSYRSTRDPFTRRNPC